MSRMHPLPVFCAFCLILLGNMLFMHPVFLSVSLICGVIFLFLRQGKHAFSVLVKLCLPVFLLTVIVNPVFSHGGKTVLFFLPTGNPFTLESLIYGVMAGTMLISVLIWFTAFYHVISNDKLLYLFGRAVPTISLLLSMIMGFLPAFRRQFAMVRSTQESLLHGRAEGHGFARIKQSVACFSVMITRSLENAVDTADSMKSREYGTKKRTNYSIYHMNDGDIILLVLNAIFAISLFSVLLLGKTRFSCFPSFSALTFSLQDCIGYAAYLLLCLCPSILERKEEYLWKHSR